MSEDEKRAKKREYLKQWHAANRERVREYRKKIQPKVNAQKRAKYAADAATREYYKANAKRWHEANPDKRLGQRVKKYGLTAECFDAMLAAQGGGCAICGRTKSGHGGLHVDHCHATGKVRGILCHSCNVGLGNFADDPERMAKAVSYLRERSGKKGDDF